MSGTINISRGLFGSPNFKREPLTEREAWIWLLMEASWSDRDVPIGEQWVPTERGQVAAAMRFMMNAWQWKSPSRVKRFLEKLEKRNAVRLENGTGVTVVTICKYDEYQYRPGNGGTRAERKTEQRRNTGGTNYKKDEIKEEEISFDEFWSVVPRKAGKKDSRKAFSKALKSTSAETIISGMRAYAMYRDGKDPKYTKTPAAWLNGERWSDELPPQFSTINGGRNDAGADAFDEIAYAARARGTSG